MSNTCHTARGSNSRELVLQLTWAKLFNFSNCFHFHFAASEREKRPVNGGCGTNIFPTRHLPYHFGSNASV